MAPGRGRPWKLPRLLLVHIFNKRIGEAEGGTYPATSLAEARTKARTLLAQVQAGEDPVQVQSAEAQQASGMPTLKEYYREFEQVYVNNPGAIRNSTRDHYRWAYEKHVLKSRLARMRMDEVSKTDLEKFVSRLVKKGYARDSIHGIVRVLGKLFNRAVDEGLIVKSPVRKLGEFFRQAPVRNEDINPFSHGESQRLLRMARQLFPDDYYCLFLTAIHTGLRSGEMKALKWDDLDLENMRIEVRRNHSHGQTNAPKTRHGRRTVDMSELLCAEMKRWRTQLQKEWLAKGFSEIPKWVFPNQVGRMLDLDNLKNRQYKRLLRKAKLRYIPFHCLRDTFATLLLMAKVPLTYISEQLGHKDPSVTVEHYARWLPGSNREAMDVLPGPDVEITGRSEIQAEDRINE